MTSVLIWLFGQRLGVVLKPLFPYMVGALASLYLYNIGYTRGVQHTDARYQIAMQKERQRQAEANSAALENAQKRQAQLERLLDERDATISTLLLEGAADPNAGRLSVGSDSVRRLNQVR